MYAALVNPSQISGCKRPASALERRSAGLKCFAWKAKGYRNHPQLMRFKITHNPSAAIACYLKKTPKRLIEEIIISTKPRSSTWSLKSIFLLRTGKSNTSSSIYCIKLKNRDQNLYEKFKNTTEIELHPLFYSVTVDVEDWEIHSIYHIIVAFSFGSEFD